MNADSLDELLGIDRTDPIQDLASRLVEADDNLMQALHAHRRESGPSIEQVAERMETLPHRVRHLEFADADPTLSTLRRYALAIGVMVEHHVSPPSSSVDEGNPDR